MATAGDAAISVESSDEGDTRENPIKSDVFLQHTVLRSKSISFDDNYFHMIPNVEKRLKIQVPTGDDRSPDGTVSSLNMSRIVSFR